MSVTVFAQELALPYSAKLLEKASYQIFEFACEQHSVFLATAAEIRTRSQNQPRVKAYCILTVS